MTIPAESYSRPSKSPVLFVRATREECCKIQAAAAARDMSIQEWCLWWLLVGAESQNQNTSAPTPADSQAALLAGEPSAGGL